MIAESLTNKGIKKALQDQRAIKMEAKQVESSEKLTRVIAEFMASQVSKPVKDISVEGPKIVSAGPWSPMFGPPTYASLDKLIKDSSWITTRSRNHRRRGNKNDVVGRKTSAERKLVRQQLSDGINGSRNDDQIGQVVGQNCEYV